ncbi:terminase small subunit [Paraflavitalea sp. CAU 1676]|uniref:terminase small subunit n=1 Tax=Paraflavitalea sp. CAU 1676 TaxID=3032598 RepID=UPI0023DBB4C7|nr:terminase small subunit [Paraflavitalea sp. CAU 1676]MDF2189298.1 terminase small subunit [Paraflavitalea sp. CAU 1676]
MTSLSDQQIHFCNEYLVDFNASRAAVAAGYSKKTAASIASRLLTKVNIQAYLSKKKEKVAAKLDISMERTLLEIARVAYSDPRRLFDEEGRLKPITELDDDTAAVISHIEVDEDVSMGDDDIDLEEGDEDGAAPPVPAGPKAPKGPKMVGTSTTKVKLWSKLQALGLLADHFGIKKPAPAPVNNINLSSLSDTDLKALQAMKQKSAG